MPYKSDRQRRFFHTNTARKKGITRSMTEEYDKELKGLELPEKANKFSKLKKALKKK